MCGGGEGGYKTRDSMYVLNIVFLSSLCFRTPRLASQARPSPSGHKSLCKPSPSPSPSPAADGEGGTKFSGCTAAGVPSRTPETQTTASTIINPHSPRCPRPTFSASLAASTRPNHTPLPTGRAEWPAARERRRRYPPELQLRPDRGPGVHPAEVRGSGPADRGLPFAHVCQAGGGHGGIVSRHNLGQHLSGTEAGVHTHSR